MEVGTSTHLGDVFFFMVVCGINMIYRMGKRAIASIESIDTMDSMVMLAMAMAMMMMMMMMMMDDDG